MGHVAVGHRWDQVAMDLLDGPRPVRCRTRPHCLWRMLSSNTLSAASECLVSFIRIKAGNLRIKLCRNCVSYAARIKLGLLHIIRRLIAYRSSVHESRGFSPYRLMFGEECMFQMDIGLP